MSKPLLVFNETHYNEMIKKSKEDTEYYKSIVRPVIPTKASTSATCLYLNLKFGIGEGTHYVPGYFTVFSADGVPIRGIPAVCGDRNKDEMRTSFAFKRSQCLPFGDAMMLMNQAWLYHNQQLITEINGLRAAKKEVTPNQMKYLAFKEKGIGTLCKDSLSMLNAKNPGKKLDDELINFKFSFGKFPKNHPYGEEGKDTIEIYDYNTKKPNVAGKSFDSYQKATVEKVNPDTNEVTKEPITEHNVHEFVKSGSKVVLIKFAASTSASGYGVNWANKVWKMVIKPGTGSKAAGEEEAEEEELPPPTQSTTVQPTAEVVQASPDEVAENVIDDL